MSRFCYNDTIYRFKKNGKFQIGVVWETGELMMSEEEEVDEKKLRMLRDNHCIDVCWYPSGRLQIISEQSCKLLDRYIQQGDYVRRISGPSQLGFCLDVHGSLALRILNTNKVIVDASFSSLKPLVKFRTLDIVLYENWIGIVKEVEKEITVSTVDGSLFIMTEDVFMELERVYETYDKKAFGQCFLYLGQILRGSLKTFEKSQWKNVSSQTEKQLFKKYELLTVKVVDIDATLIKVQWICGTFKKVDLESSYTHPKENLNRKDIKNVIKINDYRIFDQYQGSYSHYILKETDTIIKLSRWKKGVVNSLLKNGNKSNATESAVYNQPLTEENKGTASGCTDTAAKTAENPIEKKKKKLQAKSLLRRYPKRKKTSGSFKKSGVPGEMVGTEVILSNSVVDVLWQDGKIETGVPSTILYPPSHVDNNEYFPGEFVVENVESPNGNQYGVVQSVNHDNRTLNIVWLQYTLGGKEQLDVKVLREEETSVYNIKPHQDFRFKPGSYVLKIANLESLEEFPSIGKVLGTKHPGLIQVKWLSGSITESFPQELYLVNTNEFIDELDAFPIDIDSWESLSETYEDIVDVEVPKSFLPCEDKVIEGEITDYVKIQDIVQNPFLELPKLFEDFCKNPTLVSSSQIYKIFELCNQCKKFEGLILKVIKSYTGRQGESLRNAAYEIANYEEVKVTAITTTFLGSPRLIKELDTYINENIDSLIKNDVPMDKFTVQVKEDEHDSSKDIKVINDSIIIKEQVPRIISSEDAECYLSYHSCHRICQLLEAKLNENDSFCNESIEQASKRDETSKIIEEIKLENENLKENVSEPRITNAISNENLIFQDFAPQSHHFIKESTSASTSFSKALNKEYKLLLNALPDGILVKAFQDRTDLLSVLIRGPKETPYEEGLFYFDLHLPPDYPRCPPLCYYASFCSERLNPNLYEEGKVCLSLLGTWVGEGTEVWVPCKSTLLQVLVSIQSLILVSEPYFNEAGYEKQMGSEEGKLNSRLYNEMAIIKVVDSMAKMIENPPQVFLKEINSHFQTCGSAFCERMDSFIQVSEQETKVVRQELGYPLLPASKGFCISLRSSLKKLRTSLSKMASVKS